MDQLVAAGGDQDRRLIAEDGMVLADEPDVTEARHQWFPAAAGAARQYSGTVGGVALCQVAVTVTYATGRGHALIGRALYLPGRVPPMRSTAS